MSASAWHVCEYIVVMTFLSVCYTNIRTNSTYYLQHTTDWTELNVLLYDGTRCCCVNGIVGQQINEYDDDDGNSRK